MDRISRTWAAASWTNSWGTEAWGAEYQFLCVDTKGNVGVFLAAGEGAIPDGEANSIAEMMQVVDALGSLVETSDGVLSFSTDEPSIYVDEMYYTWRGVWVFDWTPSEVSNELGYFKKARPTVPLRSDSLPPNAIDFAYLIEDVDLASATKLTPPSGLIVPIH